MTRRDLITGLPADVPATLITLLLWLHGGEEPTVDSPTPSIDALAAKLHDSPSSVQRAVNFGVENDLLIAEYIFFQGKTKVRVSRYTKLKDDIKGQIVGRLLFPNWTKIQQLQDSSIVILTTPKSGRRSQAEYTAGVSTRGLGEEGKEGSINPSQFGGDFAPAAICTLAWRELEKRFREAQELRGIPPTRRVSLVHGKRDTYTLRQMIATIPEKGRWLPYMRTVNLFSFWIEGHPLKNLKTAMGAFLGNHQEWLLHLHEWEATATEEFRVLKVDPETTDETANDDLVPTDRSFTEKNYISWLSETSYQKFAGFVPIVKAVRVPLGIYGYDPIQGLAVALQTGVEAAGKRMNQDTGKWFWGLGIQELLSGKKFVDVPVLDHVLGTRSLKIDTEKLFPTNAPSPGESTSTAPQEKPTPDERSRGAVSATGEKS